MNRRVAGKFRLTSGSLWGVLFWEKPGVRLNTRNQQSVRDRMQKTLLRRIRASVPDALLDRVPALMEADAPSEQVSVRDTSYPVQVTQIIKETDNAVTIRFTPMEGYRLHYRAGQYVRVAVEIGHGIFRRCYSLTSSPEEKDMAITVKKVFRGRVSKVLVRRLKVGDVFSIEDPMGDFVLPVNHPYDNRYVMVAGGSGIAPVFALIKDILAKNEQADIQLLYTNRTPGDVVYKKSLDHMEKFYKGFSVTYFYTRQGGRRRRMLTPEVVLDHIADPEDTFIYVCAPQGLTRKMVEAFEQAGMPESQVRVELFGSIPAIEDNTELKPRVVSFFGSRLLGKITHVRQRKVETLLETANRNKESIPFNCTMGTCKTCKVKLRSGAVIMDEPNSLSLEEAEDGYVLACVAYPCESVMVKLPSR